MKSNSSGFTRIELAALVVALAFVAVLALPLLAGTSTASARVACFNNLRQIGNAVLLFSNNHGDQPPWLTPVEQGGTFPLPSGKNATAWTEFIALTNELSSPAVLACPTDQESQVAWHWGNTAGGFINSGLRANAVSYFLSFHGQMELGRSVVTGDRDFRPTAPSPNSCSRGAINTARLTSGDPQIEWTNAVHVGAGHLLFMDGTVEYMNSARLRAVIVGPETQNDSASIHYVNAR
jgi:hypothetical protein